MHSTTKRARFQNNIPLNYVQNLVENKHAQQQLYYAQTMINKLFKTAINHAFRNNSQRDCMPFELSPKQEEFRIFFDHACSGSPRKLLSQNF